jgi:hypothetical protein
MDEILSLWPKVIPHQPMRKEMHEIKTSRPGMRRVKMTLRTYQERPFVTDAFTPRNSRDPRIEVIEDAKRYSSADEVRRAGDQNKARLN